MSAPRIRAIVIAGLALVAPLLLAPSAASTGVPSEPQHVTVAGSLSGVRVNWAAPASDGGSALLDYVAEAYAAASGGTALETCSTVSASETTCTIEPLTSGSTYYVSVYAVNAAGDGLSSSRIQVVAGATPSVPRSVTASRVASGIHVAWLPPAENGSGAVSAYIVRAFTSTSSSADAVASCTTSGLDCTVTGVSATTRYYVSVAAVNASGEGAASSRVAVPVAENPGAPRSVSVTRGNGYARVQWATPASNGGSTITRYVARAFDSLTGGSEVAQCSPTTSRLECNVGPLPNGGSYYIDVTATNHYGDGAPSTPRIFVRTGTDSSPPRDVAAEQRPQGVVVTWAMPESDGGYSISSYTARAWSSSSGGTLTAQCRATGDSCVIAPASQAPVYIDVVAETALGESAPSAPRARLVLVDPIDAPTGVTVLSRGSTWRIAWNEPVDASKGEVLSYRADVLDAGQAVVASCTVVDATRGSAPACMLPAVRGSTPLTVSVTAETVDSVSASLPVTLGAAGAKPSPPAAVEGAPGRTSVQVSWQPSPWQGRSPVSAYRVRAWSKQTGGAVTSMCRTTNGALECALSDLVDFEPVWIDVAARNDQGWGAASARVRVESKPSVPDALDDVAVRATSDGFEASWSSDVYDGGYPIRRFVVQVTSDSAGQTVIGGCSAVAQATSCSVTGIPAGTHAYIRLSAVNTVGGGEPVVLESTVPFS
jgi:Fibronectin type III domain